MKNLEDTRRMAWEQNLIEIYKHNLMAAAGHHSYTLRDNHIADLSSRNYMRKMVGSPQFTGKYRSLISLQTHNFND